MQPRRLTVISDFNSRPLYRGRQTVNVLITGAILFQLTPPIQRATSFGFAVVYRYLFQLTPPIQRATDFDVFIQIIIKHFNSRPLYRGRLNSKGKFFSAPVFQLTPPIQRATPFRLCKCSFLLYFNSRPLYRGRRV